MVALKSTKKFNFNVKLQKERLKVGGELENKYKNTENHE